MSENLQAIESIAFKAREWAIKNRKNYFADTDLCGMCAVASAYLFKKLKQSGISCKIALRNKIDDAHCFIVTDTHIIDITATQFDKKTPPVTIVKKPSKKATPSYWKATSFFDCATKFTNKLKESGWPDEQIPGWKRPY